MQPPPDPARVLVVDDEHGPRESLRMILEPVCQVRVARSGTEALEILRSHEIELMTLDLNMPGMMGAELMRVVRSEFPNVEIIVITGAGSIESAAESVRAGICDYLTKPFDVVKVGAAAARALSRRRSREQLSRFLGELGSVLGKDREIEDLLSEVHGSAKLRGRLTALFDAPEGTSPADVAHGLDQQRPFLEVLAETIESQHSFMRGHARRVSAYSAMLASRLALPSRELELVRISAFLHDLGNVGVSTDLLVQEHGLDAPQRATIEAHAETGAKLLRPLDLPLSVSQAIRHHHEWWDGTGYPDGLAGEEIPLAARIIALADAFDAMSCDRPYRDALPRDVVIAEIERYAGVQFDPRLAKEFLVLLEADTGDIDMQQSCDVTVTTAADHAWA